MKIKDIIEPARHLPFKIMITDPASKHAMEEIKNPFSGESCQLPRYAVAVYDTIKGAELLEDPKTCLLYTSPSPRDGLLSRMPSSA